MALFDSAPIGVAATAAATARNLRLVAFFNSLFLVH